MAIVDVRQKNNDDCFNFAIEKIKQMVKEQRW